MLAYLQKLFPKGCLACQETIDSSTGGFLCVRCQAEIRLKTHAQCLVCSQDRSCCALCQDRPSRVRPSLIQVALESTPVAWRLIQAAQTPLGWKAHEAIAALLYARFLCSCEDAFNLLIALPDSQSYVGLSRYNLDLAKQLAKKQPVRVMSWTRAKFYQTKPQDRILLVGFQASLAALMRYALAAPLQRAQSLMALVALMEES